MSRNGSAATSLSCHTIVPDDQCNITWYVHNFNLSAVYIGDKVVSPEFQAGLNKNLKWVLVVYPKGYNSSYGGYVGVFLGSRFQPEARIIVKFTIGVINSSNEKCNVKSFHTNFTGSSLCGSEMLVTRSQIEDKKNGLLENDTLKIVCEMQIICPQNVVTVCSYGPQLDKLSDDFSQLYQKSELSDVVITVGGKKFRSHKAVLGARSPVFAAMFQHTMVESCKNVVEITDVDPSVMEEVITYIYSGHCPHLTDLAPQILPVSDKYCLVGLKSMVEEYLSTKLTVDNAADILILSDTYNAASLKANVLKFIHCHGKEVMKSSGWNSLTHHQHLVLEICTSMFEQCSIFNNTILLSS